MTKKKKLPLVERVRQGAINIIKVNGLHKGAPKSPDGSRFCLAGAIQESVNVIEKREKIAPFGMSVSSRRLGGGEAIAAFNDRPETTAEDAIREIRRLSIKENTSPFEASGLTLTTQQIR